MSTIASLTEDFTAGAVGAVVDTSNSIFDTTFGAGSAVFANDPLVSGGKVMEVTTTANNVYRGMDFTAVSTLWFRFDLDIDTPPEVNDAILNGYVTNAAPTTEKFFDLRISAGARTVQLRDNNTQVAITPTLAAGTKHRIYLHVECSATAGSRYMELLVYSGGDLTSQTWSSGHVTLTQAATTISHMKMGMIAAATGKFRVTGLRGDNAVQPVPAASGTVTLNASSTTPVANSTVTLTATTTGTGTLAFTQTAGTAVTLSGSGNTRTFTAPAGQTLQFQASFGGSTSTVTINVQVATVDPTVSLGPDISNAEAGTTVTLSASVTGTGSFAWSQTAGPTVGLTAVSPDVRTFTVPALYANTTLTFHVTYGGQSDDINVVVLAHDLWRRMADGTNHALYTKRVA